MYLKSALEFSSFPSLLLLMTMFRLAINVSVTRQVLLHGNAGSVVRDFGQFVVGGNVVIGLVIFVVLVVIQFVVVTNGAGRVAEVAARFTLDAMPGKQMAIDADLNTGLITDEQARERRKLISREADFHGSMDGASKFVKGDAMAAVVMVVINLLGGIIVGVVQHHLAFSKATHDYSLLTVGDGLTEQIPALLISVGMGIIVTRSGSDERDLGAEITSQILGQKKRRWSPAARSWPSRWSRAWNIPFLLIGGMFFGIGWVLRKDGIEASQPAPALAAALPAAGTKELEPKGPWRTTRGSRGCRSIRWSSASASAWCRWSTAARAARSWAGSRRIVNKSHQSSGTVIPRPYP